MNTHITHARTSGIAALVCILCVGHAAESVGQTIQLPSIRQFSYSGSVMVPDGGTASLGGNQTYASGYSRRGVPGFHTPGFSHGRQMTAGGLSVSATIIDLEAMDRQILGEDFRRTRGDRGEPRENRGNRQAEAKPNGGRQPVQGRDPIDEAKSLVRNARAALAKGKTATAKNAYQLAIAKLSAVVESAPGGSSSAMPNPAMPNSAMSGVAMSASAMSASAMSSSAMSMSGSAMSVSATETYRLRQAAYLLAYARSEFASTFPENAASRKPR